MGKIVFFDIDGTLLDDDKKMPDSTKEAVFQLKKNGIDVAIATGRAPYLFEFLIDELELDSYVSFNGQYVMFGNEVVYKNPLALPELDKLAVEASASNHALVYMNETTMKASVSGNKYIDESLNTLHFPYPAVDPSFYKDKDMYQAMLFCEEKEESMYEDKFDDLRLIRWHPYALDVVPKMGSKLIGIQKMIEVAGFDMKDVYAFGDGLNDLEMIERVGTGVAMGNALDPVKKRAKFVTKDVTEDGIYYGLKHLKLI